MSEEETRPTTRAGLAARIQEAINGITAPRNISSSPAACRGVVSSATTSRPTVVLVTAKEVSPVLPGSISCITARPMITRREKAPKYTPQRRGLIRRGEASRRRQGTRPIRAVATIASGPTAARLRLAASISSGDIEASKGSRPKANESMISATSDSAIRSEERRVGKEGRAGGEGGDYTRGR